MNLLKATLPLWIVTGLFVSNGVAGPDRTPSPPGLTPHRAPPAKKAPPVHRAPPQKNYSPSLPSPGVPVPDPPKQPAPKPPGAKPPGSQPPPTPASPVPPPGHPDHPKNKNGWGKLGDPGFWLERLGQPRPSHPEPFHPEPYHPEHPRPEHPRLEHPRPEHPRPEEPVDPHWQEPDWRPEPRPEEHPWRAHELADGPPELLNESRLTVRCYINGEPVSLSPGRAIPLERGRLSIIEYQNGRNPGMVQYDLDHGVHMFVHTSHGWELVRVGH